MSSVHIVLDGPRVVGVSARLQGAENIRINEARRIAEAGGPWTTPVQETTDYIYARLRIENHNVQDED